MNVTEEEIGTILENYRKMTVIGLSRDPAKAAHRVPKYARSRGYEIVGVHPSATNIDGFQCFQDLQDVPTEFRKFVDVFRPSAEVPEVVKNVLNAGGVEVLFLQLGISHPNAEEQAEAAGIKVVSDRCLQIELAKRPAIR